MKTYQVIVDEFDLRLIHSCIQKSNLSKKEKLDLANTKVQKLGGSMVLNLPFRLAKSLLKILRSVDIGLDESQRIVASRINMAIMPNEQVLAKRKGARK